MKNMKRIGSFLLGLALTLGLCAPAFAAVGDTGYADVDANADYAEAVAYCRENSLMNGVSADRFDPNGTLTRAMVTTVLYRAEGEPTVTGAPAFTDTEANTWYSNAVVWAAGRGIVQGYGNGLFGTTDPVSVEQLEVMVGRYTGKGPEWVGDPARAVAATRAQAAVTFYAALAAEPATPDEQEPAEGGKVLVAYFSATNNTEGVAEKIAAALGDKADLFEIVPAVPYTSADLNYNSDCRANREQDDAAARPEIASTSTVANMENYDVVFLGYPIWWGQAPRIISTFLESYDFDGKTIVPFCTSGSSGVGSSASNLAGTTPGADWLDGRRFSGSASEGDVTAWVDGLGLDG